MRLVLPKIKVSTEKYMVLTRIHDAHWSVVSFEVLVKLFGLSQILICCYFKWKERATV